MSTPKMAAEDWKYAMPYSYSCGRLRTGPVHPDKLEALQVGL